MRQPSQTNTDADANALWEIDLDLDLELEPERYELQPGADGNDPFEPTRRQFLRVLGGGLLVLCLFGEREAEALQQPGQRRRQGQGRQGGAVPREISAWLHIAEDGTVTAYSGKAEVGQNIRTSLTQAVAEELRLPVASVRLVLGDTALTPFDMGTFGSRTTPSMSPQLRKAAAAARARLVALAAEQWNTDGSALVVAEGKVTDPASGKSLGFGALTHGQKLMEVIGDDVALTPAESWKAAGTSAPKVDGRSFVTGGHKYASDVHRPGMLHGKVLRPPAYDATLAALDTSGAEAIPGVVVVREGSFAGAAAPDEATATRALAALRPEWNAPGGPSERDLFAAFKEQLESARDSDDTRALAAGLAASDLKVERSYTIAYIAHAPLEPRTAVAEWQGNKLTVWTGSQRPFGVRGELAQAFGIPETDVHVIVPDTGAGYGGKHTGDAAVEAARLARGAGRPVKRVWTREEEFTWAYFRPAGLIEVKAGVMKDGTLTAWEFHNVNSGGSGLEIPYEVTSRKVAFHTAKSPLRQGSYRALASTANHFARETHLDELARGIGMDPLALRLKNLKDERLRAVLLAAAERFGWGRSPSKAGSGRGVGIAGGIEKGGHIATCAEVAVDRSSGQVKVVRVVAAFECGAIINPDHLSNQVEGAIVMGLGGALFEAIRFDRGTILNPRFSRYRVPRFSDVPTIDVVLLDRKDLPSSGAGETPIVAIAPAVANAIFDATGVRLHGLPLVPEGLKQS
jgi:isoquinoline 1-oxidoreductase